uniref:Uncharacterized protein n=1 Tax=Moniliophthora roreri TaxID=221103 RepID=A0A0W0EXI1_MONRR
MEKLLFSDWEGRCKVPDCALPVNVILKSCDGKRYGAHAKNLEVFNDGFPVTDFVVLDGQDVLLEEKGDITFREVVPCSWLPRSVCRSTYFFLKDFLPRIVLRPPDSLRHSLIKLGILSKGEMDYRSDEVFKDNHVQEDFQTIADVKSPPSTIFIDNKTVFCRSNSLPAIFDD